MVSKMVSKSESEALFCPRCGRDASRAEWRLIFRRLRSNKRALPPVNILRHRPCKEVVYLVVE